MDAREDYLRRSRPRLLRVARMTTGSWADGEDLLEEAYLRTARKLVGLDSDRHRDAYVLRSMYRLQARRARRLWTREVADGAVSERSSAAVDVDEALHVRAALLALPVRQRMTLVCRFYLDLSVAQTATAMGCGVGTVKSQTAHGLQRLRDELENQ
jgi:RNA polymerase sigma factor (sigma-70 family)